MAPACAGRKLVGIMFYNYIIQSSVKKYFYVGLTKNIEARFKQHNLGQVKSTKPYNLIFVQITDSINRARDLEKYLKIRWNKESLLKLIS